MDDARLGRFLDLWNEHDAAAIAACFADDCAYHASFGPELLGRSFTGRDAVREGVQAFFDRYPDGRFVDGTHFVAGDRGAAEWTFVATEPDGSELRVRGADLFEFAGDLVKTKNAFRKQTG